MLLQNVCMYSFVSSFLMQRGLVPKNGPISEVQYLVGCKAILKVPPLPMFLGRQECTSQKRPELERPKHPIHNALPIFSAILAQHEASTVCGVSSTTLEPNTRSIVLG